MINLLKNIISLSNQRILVPFYHKVSDTNPSYEKYLYKARKIEDFKNDINIFNKYYRSVKLEKLIKLYNSETTIKQNYYHITFDDGLSNFYNVVAPILEENDTTATVFVNTDFVDNKALFYRYKASLLIQYYESSKIKTQDSFHSFFSSKESIKEKLLSIKFESKNILDDLADYVGFSFNDFLEKEQPYLSSKQIENLLNRGFTVGAHSQNHPLYSNISYEEQLSQTEDSIAFLKQKFNLNYNVFSFPFTDLGVSNGFFQSSFYKNNIDLSFGTSGIKKDKIKNNFQRLFFEIDNKKATSYLLEQYIKYLLKIPLGRSNMPRN